MLSALAGNPFNSVKGQRLTAQPDRAAQTLPSNTIRANREGNQGGVVNSTVSLTSTGSTNLQTYQAHPGAVSVTPGSGNQDAAVLDRMRNAMFSQAGDDNYDAGLDFDADGQVNFADVRTLFMGEEPTDGPVELTRPPAPPPMDHADAESLKQIRNSMFANGSGDALDAGADLNGDGQVNFADLAMLRKRENESQPAPEPDPGQTTLGSIGNQIRDAFFASQGDDGFDPALDLNNDGRINFADLAALRQKEDARPDDSDEVIQPVIEPNAVGTPAVEAAGDRQFESLKDTLETSRVETRFVAANRGGSVGFEDLAALNADDV